MLVLVQPETVARWQRAGFKAYWAMLCTVRKPVGEGRRISREIRELIFRVAAENPTWGAPRIDGELLCSARGIGNHRIPLDETSAQTPESAKRWLAFLRSHREAVSSPDR